MPWGPISATEEQKNHAARATPPALPQGRGADSGIPGGQQQSVSSTDRRAPARDPASRSPRPTLISARQSMCSGGFKTTTTGARTSVSARRVCNRKPAAPLGSERVWTGNAFQLPPQKLRASERSPTSAGMLASWGTLPEPRVEVQRLPEVSVAGAAHESRGMEECLIRTWRRQKGWADPSVFLAQGCGGLPMNAQRGGHGGPRSRHPVSGPR
jgi:hypothetical protein